MHIDQQYDPLDRKDQWDDETRELVLRRVEDEVGIDANFVFLNATEGALLVRISDILLNQCGASQHIKIVESIDKKLSSQKRGVRYGNNPWPGEFYKKGLSEILKIMNDAEDEMLFDVIEKVLSENKDDFLTAFLKKVLHDAAEIFYSHPAAWAEIGFPGPAYPIGYPFLKCDEKELWEPEYINPEYEKR